MLCVCAGIADVIEEVLLQQGGGLTPHLHIVSNHMLWKDDHLVGFSKPSFHVFNKTAKSAKHSPFFQTHDLAHRDCLILVGDSLGDIAMSDGLTFHEDHIIRIGYLNDKVERLPEYLAAYDVVIVGDPSFQFPMDLIKDVLSK